MQEADKRMQLCALHCLHSFTDTSCVSSTRRAKDLSYPTQVSEHNASNADEVLFSNGRSIRVENGLLNTTTPTNNQAPDSNRTQRLQKQKPKNLTNDTEDQHVDRVVLKRPPKQPRYPNFIDFSERLRSFARWWKQNPTPIALCEVGFFYTSKFDCLCICFALFRGLIVLRREIKRSEKIHL